MEQPRLTSRLATLSPLVLAGSYVGAQLLLRGVATLAPRLAPLTVIASIALLLLLIGTVAYLRDDHPFRAGALLAFVESVSHLTTDVASGLLNGGSIGRVVTALPRAFIELLVRLGALGTALTLLVWLVRRLRPRDAPVS